KLKNIVIPPGFGTPPPTPEAPPPAPGQTPVADIIDNGYNLIEYWVDYGFELGAWAFSWLPWIGWLAPQIWPMGFNFFEGLIRAGVFNFTDWLRGQGSVIDNVVDWGGEAWNLLLDYGRAQWNFWIGWLPLPPLPGILSTDEEAEAVGVAPKSTER